MKLSEMSNKPKSNINENAKNKSINDAYEELKDCSGDELMSRLAKEVQSQKASGSFDYEALKSSIEKIKTYLPAQTYENMIRIIESLR